MLRIYGETPELDIDNNADIGDVVRVMEELDELYKERSAKTADYITVHRDSLYFAFLHVIESLNDDNVYVVTEVINNWDRFSKEEQDIILDKLFIQLDNIKDEKVHSWYEKHNPSNYY